MTQWVTCLTCNWLVVSSNPIKGSCCFLGQETFSSLLSTAFFPGTDLQSQISQSNLYKPYGRLTIISNQLPHQILSKPYIYTGSCKCFICLLLIVVHYRLPWWFLYINWTLVVTVSLICSYFVMLYGLKYGYQRSVEWLIAFLTGFTQSAFVIQPIKVSELI